MEEEKEYSEDAEILTRFIVNNFDKLIPFENPNVALHNLIAHIEWLERGIAEWRSIALETQEKFEKVEAVSQIAINHLTSNIENMSIENMKSAELWLKSIGVKI